MNKIYSIAIFVFLAGIVPARPQTVDAGPKDWVDQKTGHRIVRLSEEPGSSSFYFHQNAYTASGDKMVFSTSSGLSTYNFKTKNIESIVDGKVSDVIVGRKTRCVFYLCDDSVYQTDIDSKETRKIATDPRLRTGSGFALNSNEALLGGSMVIGQGISEAVQAKGDNYPGKGEMMERRLAAKIPMALYTIDIKTGRIDLIYSSTDWLNHVQFSPGDPGLMMFCHEGPWHKVDRIWTIRSNGSDLKKIHTRTMAMEIAGHEFFGADGRFIYYDLQTPKGQIFWLAKYEIRTGRMTRYGLTKHEWSVHFNVSPNGAFYSGDGGGPNSVAKGDNGQWIYLFRPRNGRLWAEKLVDLSRHDYTLEPNATFTPDGKWLVFRSNMYGPTQIYAVEVKRSKLTNVK